MRFFVFVGIFRQLFLDRGELSAQQRTIIGKRTSRVNEREKDDFAFELPEMQGFAVLIDHRDIGNLVANHEDPRGRAFAAGRPAALPITVKCSNQNFPGCSTITSARMMSAGWTS